MLDVKITTVRKAKSAIEEKRARNRKRRRKAPIIEEYERYLRMLERGKAITFELNDGDKFQTIRYRLNSAAKSIGAKNLKVERAGSTVVVYKEAKPRARKVGRRDGEMREIGLDDVPVEEVAEAVEDGIGPVAEDELVFDEELEEPMLRGYKTCEARAQRFDGTGFEAFGRYYVITKVEQLTLGEVSETWFREHGHFSTKEFREIWKQRHGGLLDPDQKVWLHHFERGFEPPADEDSAGLDTVETGADDDDTEEYSLSGPDAEDDDI
jgi:hypothetical protein